MDENVDPGKISSIDTSRMGRRSLMKRLSALGFGGLTASTLTAEDVEAASKDEVPITYAIEADDRMRSSHTPKKRMVPADWYKDIRQAHRNHNQYEFRNISGIVGTTILPGDFDTGSAQIQVEISPEIAREQGVTFEESRKIVPESIGETPTRVVRSSPPEQGCYEEDYGSQPPVGCYISGTSGSGSLGCPLYKDGQAYFSTNYHLFSDQSDPSGADLENWNGDTIGTVDDWDCKDDFVAVSPASGYSVTNSIVESSNYIGGYYTEDGIDSLAADGVNAKKRGQTTCDTAGEIKGQGGAWVYDANCIRRQNQVKWGTAEEDFSDGDSGSAAYASENESTNLHFALCINAARVPKRDPTGDYVFGTATWHLNNEYGYSF